jgi:C1A family cysteine protease
LIGLFIVVALQVVHSQKGRRPTVAEINAAIKAKGACWIAKENKFSFKTFEELKAMLGTFPLEAATIEFETSTPTAGKGKPKPSTLPESFDWRDYNGNWVTPVKDQGDCGSCWAFGTVAQMESLIRIFNNNPDLDVDLSEQFIVSCDTSNYGCDGGYMNRVYDFVRDTGTPDEACFPYSATDEPCDNRCSDWEYRVEKIDKWAWVCKRAINNDKIKEAVYNNGPLTCTMDVYYDFFFYESGCYQHVYGPYMGGHAVCIVGWTADDCWIVKNSWGTDWGENGFFKIKFRNCGIGLQSGKFTYTGSK